ncbi:hypothetical protein cyc_03280 [Cyclospora cayetanensis]|nr:hypothetical protein cyc_03280 [Cyclospora cayetanensis]
MISKDFFTCGATKRSQNTDVWEVYHPLQGCYHDRRVDHFTDPSPRQQVHGTGAVLTDAPLSSTQAQAEMRQIEYEYYVWDTTTQEYVQTDQETGEKMLQNPHYFQYHYRLVENTNNGEAQLLPEPLDELGCPLYQRNSEQESHPHVEADHLYDQQFTEELDDASGAACVHATSGYQATPESLVPPRQERCCVPKSTHLRCCTHAVRNTLRCNHQAVGKENFASPKCGGHKKVLQLERFCGEGIDTCEASAEAPHTGCRRIPTGKNVRPQLDATHPSHANKSFYSSCSRPWQNSPASIRDRELQVRQLRHLKRLQQLEKDELLRRQMMLDTLAATLPTSTDHAATSERNGTHRQKSRPASYTRMSGSKTIRPSPRCPPEGNRKVRNDPVNRGRYFRAKWKSDRFLEQQKHPTFDVKAYDAWLKSSGHLLRGKVLELQLEEQRLLSKLKQERPSHSK